ncbi:hypothetical protein BH10BDE1_BH10BDE1_12870 [soil metagenome]
MNREHAKPRTRLVRVLFFQASIICVLFAAAGFALAGPTKINAKVSAKVNAKAGTKKSKAKTKKKSVDYNAPGIAAFQNKNYVEALRLFGIATKNDPKNALAWLYQARSVVAVYGATEPENYCNFEKNWIFDALASLSKATELGSAKILPVLASIRDPNFGKLRARPEFKNWDLVRTLPLKSDLATQEFFAKHNDWLIEKGSDPVTVVTFSPTHELTISPADGARETGTWSAGTDRVVIKTKTEMRTLNLTTAKYSFGTAGKSFRVVVLKDSAKSGAWSIGPEIADCPKP